MKSFILALAAVCASAFETHEMFKFTGWMADHGKQYSTVEEFEYRIQQFLRREEAILKHNAQEHSYTMGHNSRSDWSAPEFENILTYMVTPEEERSEDHWQQGKGSPQPIDWRSQGAVNKIQDQGQCGSCWAFSSVQSMEGRHKVSGGRLEKFSEQQLVDCVTTCSGCGGGMETRAFDYYKKHDALAENAYPYTGRNGRCRQSEFRRGSGVHSNGHTAVRRNDPEAMKTALQGGPLSVAIEADKMCFQNYRSGIFDNTSCGHSLDHAVGLVGWGKEAGREYWIVRNSWGKSWGEHGYIRMAIESGKGVCGVQMEPVYPKGVN